MYLPVRPHMAIFSPARMVSEMFSRARTAFSASGFDVGLSRISMSLKLKRRLWSYPCHADMFLSTIEPACGHSTGGSTSSPG